MLGTFLIGLTLGSAVVYVGYSCIYSDDRKRLTDKISLYEELLGQADRQVHLLMEANGRFKIENQNLKMRLAMANELDSRRVSDPVMKEAAKKAMVYSHPDKTGQNTTDEFIKFKKLYDSLK